MNRNKRKRERGGHEEVEREEGGGVLARKRELRNASKIKKRGKL